MKNDIVKIFRLQAFRVINVFVDERSIEIEVALKKKHLQCPLCGKQSSRCHQIGKNYLIKHQLWGEKTVYIKGRKNRWKCFRCGKPFTESWPGVKKWSRKTETAEFQILSFLKNKSFRQLKQENGVSDHEARYLLTKIDTAPT